MLYSSLPFRLVLLTLYSTFGMATTNGSPCDSQTQTHFLWRLMAVPFASPLCILVTAGFTMLLISPKTRNIALAAFQEIQDIRADIREVAAAYLEGLRELLANVRDTINGTSSPTYTQADVDKLHDFYKAQLAAKDEETEHLQQECAAAYASQKASRHEVSIARQATVHISQSLAESQRRLAEAQRSTDDLDLIELELDLRDRGDEVKALTADCEFYSLSLKKKTAELETITSKWQKLIRENHFLKVAHNAELEKLHHKMNVTTAKMQNTMDKLILDAGHHKQVIDTLCKLSEGSGDDLTVAAMFAKVLQQRKINLGAIGIHTGRVDVLWEYVRMGQSPDGWLQPQRYVKGFKLV